MAAWQCHAWAEHPAFLRHVLLAPWVISAVFRRVPFPVFDFTAMVVVDDIPAIARLLVVVLIETHGIRYIVS